MVFLTGTNYPSILIKPSKTNAPEEIQGQSPNIHQAVAMHFLLRFLVVTTFSIFILILLPIAIILLSTLIIPRVFVSFSAHLLQPLPGLGKMLTASSVIHAIRPDTRVVVLPIVVQGEPDLDKIKAEFRTKILEAKDEEGGGLLYPELTQTVVSWMGYLFWRNVPNFELPIQFCKLLTCEQLGTEEGTNFLCSLTDEGFKFGDQVLWDVHIIPGKDQFAFVIRVHHTLCDGASLIKLLDKVSSPQIIDQMVKPRRSSFRMIHCLGLLRMPWDVANYLQVMIRTWFTPDIFNDHSPLKGSHAFAATKHLYFPDVKRIATSESISVTGVIVSIIAEGLRNGLLKKSKMVGGNVILFPVLPSLNPARKLRNTAPMGFVELPFQEPDATERIRQIDAQFRALKYSSVPMFTTWIPRLWGSQFPPLLRLANTLDTSKKCALVFSSLPLNRAPFQLFGHPVLRLNPSPVGVAGSRAIVIAFGRSGEEVFFQISGDSGVLNSTEAKAFMDAIVSEMDLRLGAVNNDDKDQLSIQME